MIRRPSHWLAAAFRVLLLLTILAAPALPAVAQVVLPTASPTTPAAESSTPIATDQDVTTDSRIARRIRDIFGEIAGLRQVTVSVSSGVVTLAGKVTASGDAQQAEAIAARVAGVVTVTNRIERDVAVGAQLAPLAGATGWLLGATKALPLLALALGVGALIVFAGYLLARLASRARPRGNAFLSTLIASAIRFLFIIGGLVAAANILGAGALLGAILGGAGLVGIAIGFAVKDSVENYIASLMLSLRQPFRPNDQVVIDGHEGRVMRLTSRATVLMTPDGNHLRIPNSTVFKAVILNYTRNPHRRFEFDLDIGPHDDPLAGIEVGVKALAGLEAVLPDPAPSGVIQDVGNVIVGLRFYGWVDQTRSDLARTRSAAIHAARKALEGARFALPEPTYRVNLADNKPAPSQTLSNSPRKPSRRAAASPGSIDTNADNPVAEMVANERSAADCEQDLLDAAKPVE